MTYFGVLITFILPPLVILAIFVPKDVWRALWRGGPGAIRQVDCLPYLAILLHVFMAVIYTTPWDNYLVATGVWWYDPQLVTGIRIGYVPIEEYTFFVVQTLLTGLWTVGLMRSRWMKPSPSLPIARFRNISMAVAAVVWVLATAMLFSGWQPGTYLALILSWAFVPLLIQLIFGADLLLANWRLLLTGILPPTLYLWWSDSLAITARTWTIDPQQTTGVMFGALPFEEMLFFLITNVIIVFGLTLMLLPVGQARLHALRKVWNSSTANRQAFWQFIAWPPSPVFQDAEHLSRKQDTHQYHRLDELS